MNQKKKQYTHGVLTICHPISTQGSQETEEKWRRTETESQLVIKHPPAKLCAHCRHSNFANSSPRSKRSGTSMMSSWSPCSWLEASIVPMQINPFPMEKFTSQSACSYYCPPWSPHPQLIAFQLLPHSTITSFLWDSLSQISHMLPGLSHCIPFHPSPLLSVSKFCLPALLLGHILVKSSLLSGLKNPIWSSLCHPNPLPMDHSFLSHAVLLTVPWSTHKEHMPCPNNPRDCIRKLGRCWHDQIDLINKCQHAING